MPISQAAIPAMFMRGGTSKGVFFLRSDLPSDVVQRDQILLRLMGSPDPYEKHIDGMGGASSSTSKVVLINKSTKPGFDVDYYFGQVSVDKPLIDWSGNCGNLTAAVGPFALLRGLFKVDPNASECRVVIWQANIQKKIVATFPVKNGELLEYGAFYLDGVAFANAPIALSFIDPGSQDLFPTGLVQERLVVPDVGTITATLINAGNPGVFILASDLGLQGTESQAQINANPVLLAQLEKIRAYAAVKMGLAKDVAQATNERPATPKIAFFAPPQTFTASNGQVVEQSKIDCVMRILSMGKCHHAVTGTGSVGIAAAAAIPGTVVSMVMGQAKSRLCFGHPSGTLSAGATALQSVDKQWQVSEVTMFRSARRLMDGQVFYPL